MHATTKQDTDATTVRARHAEYMHEKVVTPAISTLERLWWCGVSQRRPCDTAHVCRSTSVRTRARAIIGKPCLGNRSSGRSRRWLLIGAGMSDTHKHGSIGGHVLPGSFFCVWAAWWFINIASMQVSSGLNNRRWPAHAHALSCNS
jgi:hypothetical protein